MKETNATCADQPKVFSARSCVAHLCDASLVDLAKEGDDRAYGELFSRHAPMTARVIQRIMRNTEDTEDLLQDACICASIHLKTFDGRAAFSTWLTRIAVNCALMLLRKRRCRPEAFMPMHANDGVSIDFVDLSPSPEKQYAHRERTYQLERAIERLSPVLQTAVTLRYSNGLRVKEVARANGISVPAVKSRLSRATSELRGLMNERHA